MMKCIKFILLICVLPLFLGCDNSKAIVGYIDPPDSISPPNGFQPKMTSEKLESIFYTALQGLPIDQIEIPTRRANNYPVTITVKEGYEMNAQMQQEILDKLANYKNSLLFITDDDGALVSSQQVMNDNHNTIKDEDGNEFEPFYLLSFWRDAYMKVYNVNSPNFYNKTSILCVLSIYPTVIASSEVNQFSSFENNISIFKSFNESPFVVDFDKKYNTVLTRDLGTFSTVFPTAINGMDINGGLHTKCWEKLKNDSEILYDAIYSAKVLEYFKPDK